jgi:hypothetical protein
MVKHVNGWEPARFNEAHRGLQHGSAMTDDLSIPAHILHTKPYLNIWTWTANASISINMAKIREEDSPVNFQPGV